MTNRMHGDEMKTYRIAWALFFAVLTITSLALAQGPADLSAANPPAAAEPASPAPLPDTASQAQASDGWRGAISIYGWFPGVHGTVGVLGHEAGFSSSFSDVFHTLKGIIPVA